MSFRRMSGRRMIGVLVGVATAGLCGPVRATEVPFGPQQVISTAANGAYSVFAADVDGDGDTDVLSASLNDNKIAWYENTDGAGTFGAQQVISTAADLAQSVIAADVDGDGDIDVLSASALDDKIAWYENDGAGTFGARRVISTAAAGAMSVHAVDDRQLGKIRPFAVTIAYERSTGLFGRGRADSFGKGMAAKGV